MDRSQFTPLYVKLPDHEGGQANLTTFGADFFEWDENVIDFDLNTSLLDSYCSTSGEESTLEAVASLLDEDPTEIIITDSASQALTLVFTYARSNDLECIVPRPWFPAYNAIPSLLSSSIRTYDPFVRDGLYRTIERPTQNQSLLIANTPSNPTGAKISSLVESEIAELTDDPNRTVVWDLSYHWVLCPKERPRTGDIRIYSLGKSLGLPGMRLGALVCPNPALRSFLTAVKRQIALHSCPLAERAICQIADEVDICKMQSLWRRKLRSRVSDLAKNLPGKRLKSLVGPFTTIPTTVIEAISGFGIPGEAFGLNREVTRICIASPDADWKTFLKGLHQMEKLR